MSRAVGLLVAHVENLRRQHDRNMLELEDAKKTIQLQNSCRSAVNPNASPGLSCLPAFVLLVHHHLLFHRIFSF